ncbi:Sulfotransferase [Gracilaria domingensis]|nr:Sulfotransferase [Gracilaria domingensis]
MHVATSYLITPWQRPPQPPSGIRNSRTTKQRQAMGHAHLNVSGDVFEQQKTICRYRLEADRTIIVHMHIPKSGGTAFALALKSECICNDIPRPQKGYCRECPNVIPDSSRPVIKFTQNLWTSQNHTFRPPYSANCKTFNASSRWFGFPRKNRTFTFYSQSRLTSGWPCGVHVSYARLRECCHRLELPGIKHVVVTLFREPLARFVSEFYQVAYNRKDILSWDWCMQRDPPLSMTEFFGMPVSFPFQSRMTKLLSGSPVQTGAAGEDWTKSGVRERALERALGVVRSTEDFLFGLAEELDLTLELFHFAFRRSFVAPSSCHSHQNASGCGKVEIGLHDLYGRPLTLTPEQQRFFAANNNEDKIMYDIASRIFYERIEAMRSLQELGSDLAIDRRCVEILASEKKSMFGE